MVWKVCGNRNGLPMASLWRTIFISSWHLYFSMCIKTKYYTVFTLLWFWPLMKSNDYDQQLRLKPVKLYFFFFLLWTEGILFRSKRSLLFRTHLSPRRLTLSRRSSAGERSLFIGQKISILPYSRPFIMHKPWHLSCKHASAWHFSSAANVD